MVPNAWRRAMRGNPDGIVTVLLFCVSAGTVAAGAAVWEAILLLACGMGFYHIRVSAAERHRETLALIKMDDSQLKVFVTKLKYIEQDSKFTQAQIDRILGRRRP